MIATIPAIDAAGSELQRSTLTRHPGATWVTVDNVCGWTHNPEAQLEIVEKWTIALTGPSSPLNGRVDTPFDRSGPAELTPNKASGAHGLQAHGRIRLKKGLKKAHFLAFERSSVSFNVVGRENFHCSEASRAHAPARQLDGNFRKSKRDSPGSMPRFSSKTTPPKSAVASRGPRQLIIRTLDFKPGY